MTSRHLLTLVLGGLVAAAVHCTSSTGLVNSWHDATYRSGSLKKPLVVAVANSGVTRIKIEDGLVHGLRGIGVDAVASYTMFPQKELTAETIKDRLPTTDRDSVMVTHLVDVKLETLMVPAHTEVYPAYADRWGTYYTHSYTVVTAPEYVAQAKTYVLQTKLWDAASERLVWTAVTESPADASLDSAIQGFADVIVKDVEKNGLF